MASKPVATHGQPVGLGHDEACRKDLDDLANGYEARIVSAHRTPKRLYEFASSARKNGFKVIIAGAAAPPISPG